LADPKVIAATPLFWHPDRDDYWMFELDRKGAFVHKSPTYELLRRIPKVIGSPTYVAPIANVARTTPFETIVAEEPAPDDAGVSGGPSSGRPGDDWATEGHEPMVAQSAPVRQSSSGSASSDPAFRSQTPTQASAERAARSGGGGSLVLRIANTDGQGARLRAEPSREAEALAVLPDGALVQALGPVLERDDLDWRRVRTEDGSEGWIAADLLAPASAGS